MYKKLLFVIAVLIYSFSTAQDLVQENVIADTLKVVDTKYREDHFYLGITHSILMDKPPLYKPRSFSTGVNVGFLRDIPINKNRTWAIAPGIGYSYFNLRNNLAYLGIEKGGYKILSSYDNNSLSLYYIDLPIEIRWRTSTPESYKFWRIYTGIKFSYLIHDKSNSKSDFGDISIRNNKDLNKFTYGVYLSAGFNTWNVYVYYGLNSLYNKNVIQDTKNKLKMFNAGLMFYIL